MSGMKNLANAVANDPSFAKTAGMSRKEADEFVCDPSRDRMPAGVKSTAPKTIRRK